MIIIIKRICCDQWCFQRLTRHRLADAERLVVAVDDGGRRPTRADEADAWRVGGELDGTLRRHRVARVEHRRARHGAEHRQVLQRHLRRAVLACDGTTSPIASQTRQRYGVTDSLTDKKRYGVTDSLTDRQRNGVTDSLTDRQRYGVTDSLTDKTTIRCHR